MLSYCRPLIGSVRRLLNDDRGQDLIEYGLLTGIVGITTLLLFTTVAPQMADAYLDWNTAQEAAWAPNDPDPLVP